MTKEQWTDLAAALEESWKQSGAPVPGAAADAAVFGETVEQIVQRVSRMAGESGTREAANQRPGRTAAVSSPVSGDGSGSEWLKTLGTVTGIGPIGTALVKLFGGGSSEDAADVAAPVKYTLPPALSVTAGLTESRSLTEISYGQGDRVRPDLPVPPSRETAVTPATPTIQIQVNAMDSRSFLDHSDEIAQAVRAAMLRSHALNDMVSEI